jgi:hypothetical protein
MTIDSLLIEVVPGGGVSSINLDNIVVSTVPEPSSVTMASLGTVLAALAAVRRRNRRSEGPGQSDDNERRR